MNFTKLKLFLKEHCRLIKFYLRFKNQYKIHHNWASLWIIIRLAWASSKKRSKTEEAKRISDIKKIKIIKL